jgi:predicted O-methyltransferase YrrM
VGSGPAPWSRLLAPLHRRHAIRQLERLRARVPEGPHRVVLPAVFRGRGLFRTLRPKQNAWEIERCFEAVRALAPRRVVEIGTHHGGTLLLWTEAAAEDAVVVSVDLPDGPFGGGYPAAKAPFLEAFARGRQRVVLVRADSHLPATRARVVEALGGAPIDFLFVDGDHSYAGARADLADYGPLVRPGGLVAFHDVVPDPTAPATEVHRLWAELRARHAVREWIDPTPGAYAIGIGAIEVPAGGLTGLP